MIMTVYPSIDVLSGEVVRLRMGDPSRATVYSSDPLETACRWVGEGARWVHLVSLDAALGRSRLPYGLIGDVASAGALVQYGGGVRSASDARAVIDAGASRVVLGTAAASDPGLPGALAVELGPDRVAVALDSRAGRLCVSGWRLESPGTPLSLGVELAAAGVRHALHTVVEKDGMMDGPAVQLTAALAEATGLDVIASGGVSSLADISALGSTGLVAGVILGRALYEGVIGLSDALHEAARGGGRKC